MAVKRSDLPGESAPELTSRRRAYADWMETGTRIGAGGLAFAYLAYVTGLLPPHVPINTIVAHWHLPAAEMASACGFYRGTSWIHAFREGDYLTVLLLAFLATVTIWSFARLIPFLIRERDLPMMLVVLAQLAILVLAASGVLHVGH